MKKVIRWMVCLLMLTGCLSRPIKQVTLTPSATLEFFAITTCSECAAFKKKAIPYLEKRFGESLTVTIYDMDDPSITEHYDHVIDSLKDFDEEYYGHSPFIVVDQYFALLGYNSGDEKALADDIEASVNGTGLSDELAMIRYEFKATSKED